MSAKKNKIQMKQVVSLILFLFGFSCVFVCSNQIRQGMLSGISVSFCVLIPSLFMPMILCAFLQNSGVTNILGKFLNAPAHFLFNISGNGLCIFILSMISGYPVGAVMCKNAFENGKINKTEAQNVSLYSICAGPAFIVIAVGETLLKSRPLGILLLICHVLSAIICAFSVSILSRLFSNHSAYSPNETYNKLQYNLTEAIVKSVSDSSKSILLICAYTCLFSTVTAVFGAYMQNDIIKNILIAVSEVTNGCIYFAEKGNLPIIAALLGFSGFSVIAQVSAALGSICNIAKITAIRVYNAALSYVLCILILKVYPISVSVSASAPFSKQLELSNGNALLSVFLFFSAVIFLYSVYQRKSKRLLDFF